MHAETIASTDIDIPARTTPAYRVRSTSVSGKTILIVMADNSSYYIYEAQPTMRSGHVAGLWYAKPAEYFGLVPKSNGYATKDEAIACVATTTN